MKLKLLIERLIKQKKPSITEYLLLATVVSIILFSIKDTSYLSLFGYIDLNQPECRIGGCQKLPDGKVITTIRDLGTPSIPEPRSPLK